MDRRIFEVTRTGLAGAAAGVLVLGLTLGPLAAVVLRGGGGGALAAADWAAVRFTVVQAAVSAAASVALAVPVARALARRRFAGRGALIAMLGAPFILPVLAGVLGLLAVFGRSGVLNSALAWVGLPPVEIYGAHGVVLAHVFFNLPLAVRLLLGGWLAIPAERFRLAASLGFRASDTSRWLERPMLREVVPGAALIIFLICMTSFAVALTLGGGPRATTTEVAIYQAVRFDFDLPRAAQLAAVQFAICAGAAALAASVAIPAGMDGGLDRAVQRWDAGGLALQDAAVLIAAAVFLGLPVGLVLARGVPGITGLPADVWAAAARSVLVAGVSAGMAVALGVALTLGALHWRWLEAVGVLALAASPLMVGTGFYILIFPLTDPAALALPLTAVANAVLASPFVVRAALPQARATEAVFAPLADGLGMSQAAWLRLVMLPRLRRPLGFSAGLAAALSMGDLGVMALFGDPARATLPLQVMALMSAYRTEDAMGAAVVLMALSLGLFWLFDRWGRADADM